MVFASVTVCRSRTHSSCMKLSALPRAVSDRTAASRCQVIVDAYPLMARHEYNNECGQYLPELNVGDIAGTLLPLMTFYLAFFTSECYSRYKVWHIS